MKPGASVSLVTLAAAAALLPIPPVAVERWYSSTTYPIVQRAMTSLSNLAPFALSDVLCLWAVSAAGVLVYRRVRTKGWKRGLTQALGSLVVAASAVYLVFLGMWGLNYRRVPLIAKLVFEPAHISSTAVRHLGDLNAATLNRLYAAAHPGVMSLASLSASFDATTRQLGATAAIVPGRPKQTLLGGYFHQASIAGMTNPFLLETLIAPDLLDVERPFVVAHEWAHLAGYADESEANFIAWLTCRHGDAMAQYSGALIMIAYASPSRPLRDVLDLGPKVDLIAIQQRSAQTSHVLRVAARQGYDKYLKANRVEKGVQSYDAVVQLILGTTLDERGYPRRR
jgi:hypothetical protein